MAGGSVGLRLAAKSVLPFRRLRDHYTQPSGNNNPPPNANLALFHGFLTLKKDIEYLYTQLALVARHQRPFELHFRDPFIHWVPKNSHWDVIYDLHTPGKEHPKLLSTLTNNLSDARIFQSYSDEDRDTGLSMQETIVPLSKYSSVNAYGKPQNRNPRLRVCHRPTKESALDVMSQLQMVKPSDIGPCNTTPSQLLLLNLPIM